MPGPTAKRNGIDALLGIRRREALGPKLLRFAQYGVPMQHIADEHTARGAMEPPSSPRRTAVMSQPGGYSRRDLQH